MTDSGWANSNLIWPKYFVHISRNGRGTPAKQISGTARWCNTSGRGLGHVPSTETSLQSIDAYVWIKNVGESDGNCFGNPPAGLCTGTGARAGPSQIFVAADHFSSAMMRLVYNLNHFCLGWRSEFIGYEQHIPAVW